MADEQKKTDEKRRALVALSMIRSEVGSVVDRLNREILFSSPDTNGVSFGQKAYYISEFNDELIRAGSLCKGHLMSGGTTTMKRFEELLRDIRHHCDVLERKD